MIKYLLIFLVSFHFKADAHELKVEPPNWWVGMKSPQLQLMIHGEKVGLYAPKIDTESIKILDYKSGDSPNYLFVDLDISAAHVGDYTIVLTAEGRKSMSFEYSLLKRTQSSDQYVGFDASDVIYLITPDRFSNGDASNDAFENLQEKTVDRTKPYTRHGGDIQGIINHLEYIKDMGFTAIWPSPLLLNDMPSWSYHGYAITDYYEVDPRFGDLNLYKKMAAECRATGLKLIMDMVFNHCGRTHLWMSDMPFRDWIHGDLQDFKITNHRRTVNQDPYASKYDSEGMMNGWFVPDMPDLNQKNPYLARYLIQNSIWWIETLELAGIRQDTYPYADKDFMANWTQTIMTEYPNFNIVGEEWTLNPLLIGYWQMDKKNQDNFKSYLRSTMDFAMQQNIVDALLEEETWDTGLIKIYQGLANDFYYSHPNELLLFADNHDMTRIYDQLNQDVALTKMALAMVLMMPRIPQIYYGTEVMLHNAQNPKDHGFIRSDMPGGWQEDVENAFIGSKISNEQLELQGFLKKMLNFRKSNSVLHYGKTMHFEPKNGVYVLARYDDEKMVTLIINKSNKPASINSEQYQELWRGKANFQNVLTGRTYENLKQIEVEAKGLLILESW